MKNRITKTILSVLLFAGIFSIASAQLTLTRKADFPGKGRFRCFSFYLDGKMYVGGGRDFWVANFVTAMNDFYEYNTATDKWTRKENIPSARSNVHAIVIDGKAYMGLGYSGRDTIIGKDTTMILLKDFYQYDVANDKWIKKADFPGTPRYQATMFSVGKKGYVLGGSNLLGPQSGTNFKDMWEYDPATDKWTQKKDLPSSGRTNSIGVTDGDFAYVGMGYVSNLTDFFGDIYRYYPATDTYSEPLPKLPPLKNVPVVTGEASFSAVYNHKLILTNVNVDGPNAKDYWGVFVYEPTNSTWTVYPEANPLGNRDDWAFGVDGAKAWVALGPDFITDSANGNVVWTKETWEMNFEKYMSVLESSNPELAKINVVLSVGTINVSVPQALVAKNLSFNLYDMNGEIIKSNKVSGEDKFDVSFTPKGPYLWAIQADGRLLKSGKITL